MIWTDTRPTKENDGQWFFMRNKTTQYLYMRQVRTQTKVSASVKDRAEGTDKDVYLCDVCHEGMTFTAYGTPLNWYSPGSIEFCGPIEMPPGYKPGSGVRLDMVAKCDKV